jgi:hypothetical protein
MSKPDWLVEVEELLVRLDAHYRAAATYVHHDPSVGLQMAYRQISDTSAQISELYRNNLP